MRTNNYFFKWKAVINLLLIVFQFALINCHGDNNQLQKAELFVRLPEFVTTPDGMAIDTDGTLVVACPNFADQSKPSYLIKISKDGIVKKWVEVPVLAETGVACPMGIAFGSDNDIFICDNQGWTGKAEGKFKGRLLRLKISGNNIDSVITVAENMEHPNGVRVKDGYLYVTQSTLSKVKDSTGLLVSAVYRFGINDRNISLSNTLEDKNILTTFVTHNKFCQYGVDGIVFDSKGNLYIGNFGDGTLYKITFDSKGKMKSRNIFAKTNFDYTLDPKSNDFLSKATKAKMRTTDGICVDGNDNIYVADFSNNAVSKVTPKGEISVISQNGDTDGRDGELNEPGEPIVWNNEIIVTNFDAVTGPDKVNSKHDLPATISVLKLK